MTELFRAAAFGLAASLLAATSAFAIEASDGPAPALADPNARQAVELVSSGVAAKAADDPNCPAVTLAPDGDSRRSAGARATVEALARDCANLGAETIVKVGVIGESTRRKKDDAAQVDAPMTIHVKDAEGREIETRRINLKVEMPEGVQKVSFQHVEENVSLPPPAAGGYANWTIVVGLDPAAPGDEVAEVEDGEAAEAPVVQSSRSSRYTRSARASRSKSARSRAVRYARSSRSGRQRIEIQPQQQPVVLSAKSQGAATVTTTTVNSTGSPMARAAQGFTERRDRNQQQTQQRPAPAQAQRQAPAPQPAAAARQTQQRTRAQPTATRAAPQPAARSAQAQPRATAQTQTN